VVNDAGHVTLQGWLAQWSMTTFIEPKSTLEYLAYLGFEPSDQRLNNTAALKITKPKRRQKRPGKVDRNVALTYIVGAPGSGKSCLLDSLLSRPFSTTYHPTIKPRTAVNGVELPGGRQCYLILEELGELDPAILENKSKLDACDLLIYAYDSSNPDSFAHLPALRNRYPHLASVPGLFVALKADKDKTTQHSEQQPDEFTAALAMNKPLHASVTWRSMGELFVPITEAALNPNLASVKSDDELPDRTNLYIALGAVVCASAAFIAIWRRVGKE
jgi:Ras family protein T1